MCFFTFYEIKYYDAYFIESIKEKSDMQVLDLEYFDINFKKSEFK